MTLLEVTDLTVSFPTSDGVVRAVRGVSFGVEAGRTLGIVGESGSGKTVLTQTLLGLTPGAQISGRALFEGTDLLTLSETQLRDIRGARIAVIFQDPLTSLHPLYKVGWQIAEMIQAHDKSVSKKQAHERAVELLGRVGIPRPDRRVDDYPHQFSGGMRQRAMIAMALSLSPRMIVADEPTTALDATVQAQIIDLLLRLQQESNTALIMITHDLGVVADIADDVMVMYAGRAAEKAVEAGRVLRAAPPVHQGAARVDTEQYRLRRPAAAYPGLAAEPDQPAIRMQVPPAVRLRARPVPDRGAGAAAGQQGRLAQLGLLAAGPGGRPGRTGGRTAGRDGTGGSRRGRGGGLRSGDRRGPGA